MDENLAPKFSQKFKNSLKPKASEATISKMLCRAVKVSPVGLLDAAIHSIEEVTSGFPEHMHLPWDLSEIQLYPWRTDVIKNLVKPDLGSELVSELYTFADEVFLVQEEKSAGLSSLWLCSVVSNGEGLEDLAGYVVTFISGSFQDDEGGIFTLIGIRLESLTSQWKKQFTQQ